jgi:hypothetical protein
MKITNLIKRILSMTKDRCKNCPGCSEKSIKIKMVRKEVDE